MWNEDSCFTNNCVVVCRLNSESFIPACLMSTERSMTFVTPVIQPVHVALSPAAFTPVTGYNANKLFHYPSSAVHTLSQLQQVPGLHRHPLHPHINFRVQFVSTWSNVHICQERHHAKQDTQREEEKWLEPPEPRPVRCLLFSDWLAGKTNKVNGFVCFYIHCVYLQHPCLCEIFVTVHVSYCATAKKTKTKKSQKTKLDSHMLQALTHCTTVLWPPPTPSSSTPPVSIWQGDMSRMRGERLPRVLRFS